MFPLYGMPSQNSGALSGTPFGASAGGVLSQGGGQPSSPLTSGAMQPGASQPAAQSNNSQWQALISMLMQKLGMGAIGGGASGGAFGGSNPNSGFLPSYNISGIYSR